MLPRPDEPDAPIVTLIRTTYDPNETSIMDVLEMANLATDYVLFANDNLVVAGQVHLQSVTFYKIVSFIFLFSLQIYVYDLQHLTIAHILQCTPLTLKQMLLLFEKSLPVRLKAIHIINAPSAFMSIFNVIKSMLTEKVKQRVGSTLFKNFITQVFKIYIVAQIFVHSTMDDLWKHLPEKIFPSEYGGKGGPISDFILRVQKNITSARTQLLENRNYGIDETKRTEKSKTCQSTDDGVVGSFRKLTLD
jgi:hypothetical protein